MANLKTVDLLEISSTSLALALATIAWLAIAGKSPEFHSAFASLMFMGGMTCWANVSRMIWSSNNTLACYLPIGMGFSAGVTVLFIECRLGTVLSATLASLLGIVLHFIGAKQYPPRSKRVDCLAFDSTPYRKSILHLLVALTYSSFLMIAQLRSLSTLSDLSVSTVVQGWSDLIIHANTTLSLSNLPFSSAPISTDDAQGPMALYHLGSYVFPALISSVSKASSPLLTYTSIVTPLGFSLLALPLLERMTQANKSIPGISGFCMASATFFMYSLWIRSTTSSFYDPAWLLAATPATIYASSMILAGLQIVSNSTGEKKDPFLTGILALTILTLTFLFKFQIFHSVLIAGSSVVTICLFSISKSWNTSRRKVLLLFLSTVSLVVAAQLIAYRMLGIDGDRPFSSFLEFLIDTTNIHWHTIGLYLRHLEGKNIFLAILGTIILCGPVFVISWSLVGKDSHCLPVPKRIIILVVASYFLGLLVGPVMPWDPSEFQNRSWPLLWCIGLWLIAGFRFRVESCQRIPVIGLTILLLLLGWAILPASKQRSAASPAYIDWTKSYYPLAISSSIKESSLILAPLKNSDLFFVDDTMGKERSDLNDTPSLLAALSAKRPLLSRTAGQIKGVYGNDKETKLKLLRERISKIGDKASLECRRIQSNGQNAKRQTITNIQDNTGASIWLICGAHEDSSGSLKK